MSTDKQLKFSRLKKVIGDNYLDALEKKSVLILGCGGVGGYVVESLARSGIGTLILVDFDKIDETNINRQIIALESNVGNLKVDELEKRIKNINKDCNVVKVSKFIEPANVEELFQYNIDFFVDCCDTVRTKKEVILECLDRKVPFISCMGTGNKIDPTKLEIVDIRQTNNDPIARIIRKFVKDNKINKKVMVLSSLEVPVKTGERTPGSTVFVPSVAGIMIGAYVFRKLIQKKDITDDE